MTMGEFIRENRKKLGISQEELGQMFEPPINRAAVSKWEKGHVMNIKRSQIQRMSEIFNCNPCKLMCFDDSEDTYSLSIESDEQQLLNLYRNLNNEGRIKMTEYANDLVASGNYKKPDPISKNIS